MTDVACVANESAQAFAVKLASYLNDGYEISSSGLNSWSLGTYNSGHMWYATLIRITVDEKDGVFE